MTASRRPATFNMSAPGELCHVTVIQLASAIRSRSFRSSHSPSGQAFHPRRGGASIITGRRWPGGKGAMRHSEYDPVAKERRPWNAGRKLGAKRALKAQQVWAISFWLERERRLRDRAMFDLAIDSKLRGCDIVKIKIGDLVSRRPGSLASYRSSTEDWPPGSVRAPRACGFAPCSWSGGRRCSRPLSTPIDSRGQQGPNGSFGSQNKCDNRPLSSLPVALISRRWRMLRPLDHYFRAWPRRRYR